MPEYIFGSPITHNIGTQDLFVKRIRKDLVNPMMKETEERVNGLFEEFAAGIIGYAALNSRTRILLTRIERKYGNIYRRSAEKIANNYFNRVKGNSVIGVKRNLKLLSMGVYSENKRDMQAVEKAGISSFEIYLTGVTSFYFAKVKKEVELQALRANQNSAENVRRYLLRQRGITRRNAENELRNNYRSVFDAITGVLLLSSNIDEWQWVYTFRSNDPRKYHKDVLANQIFSNDQPPVIDERTGEIGFPGQLRHCKCVRRPVRRV